MKIFNFFSRATIILCLQICFVTSLTVSFCEPVFAAKKSKKKKSKKKSAKKKRQEKRRAEARKAEKREEEKNKIEENKAGEKKLETRKLKKTTAKQKRAALTKFQTETTYWCGSVYCDRAVDNDDAACLLSSDSKEMKCIYGDIKSNPRDASLKKLKKRPENDTGMEMCLYELRARCDGYSASFNNDKDIVSADCEKNDKLHRCLPAFENVPAALAEPDASVSFPAATGASSLPSAIPGFSSTPPAVAGGTSPLAASAAGPNVSISPPTAGGPIVEGAAPPIRPVVIKGAAAPLIPGTTAEPIVTK
jgi:hypothetical protein